MAAEAGADALSARASANRRISCQIHSGERWASSTTPSTLTPVRQRLSQSDDMEDFFTSESAIHLYMSRKRRIDHRIGVTGHKHKPVAEALSRLADVLSHDAREKRGNDGIHL